MKRILFPTDLSKGAHAALTYALNLANEADAKITLLHIEETFHQEATIFDNSLRHLVASDQLSNVLADYTAQMNTSFPDKEIIDRIELIAYTKELPETIISYANEEQIDMICIGAKGINPLLESMLGSTSQYVLEHADKPVLCVPPNYIYKAVDQVVLGANFQALPINVLTYSQKLAKILQAKLQVVDVDIANNPLLQENLDQLKTAYASDNDTHFSILEGLEVVDTLTKYIKEVDAELLILSSHKRNFFQRLIERSYSEEFIQTKSIPLLVIKESTSK